MKETDFLLEKQWQNDDKIVEFIIEVVGGYYNCVDNYHLLKSRKPNVVRPRQVAMYLSFNSTTRNMTLGKIGEFFERDHSTVLHSNKKVQGYLDYDKKFRAEIEEIKKVIQFKRGALNENISFFKKYHYIDLNDFLSIQTIDNKGVLLTGFTKQEEAVILSVIDKVKFTKKFTQTGRYILEKK